MRSYKTLRRRSRETLACAITKLIESSPELVLCDRDIKEVLYKLAQQDWRDHHNDDRQLELFPVNKYTTNGGRNAY